MKVPSVSGALRNVGIGVVALVLFGSLLSGRARNEPAVQVGPLVASIQRMGQLHTVRYNMQDVVEHERSLEPQGILRSLPGADAVYHSATRNKVLVVAEGGVEAGVDLSKVTPENVTAVRTTSGTRYRVRLPRATVYNPDVHVRVVNHDQGLFWNDENIVPEATRTVEQRFVAAAQKSDILATAETNALQMLTQMHLATGRSDVEFVF